MPLANERTTRLLDDVGAAHDYRMDMLPVGVALELSPKLLDLIGGTVDFSRGVGSSISGLGAGLVRLGAADFVLDVLQTTSRDGLRLDNQATFEQAFTGNLGELVRVLDWVVCENFRPFGVALRDTIGAHLSAMLNAPDESSVSWLASLMSSGASGASSAAASAATSRSAGNGASTTSVKRSNTSTRPQRSTR